MLLQVRDCFRSHFPVLHPELSAGKPSKAFGNSPVDTVAVFSNLNHFECIRNRSDITLCALGTRDWFTVSSNLGLSQRLRGGRKSSRPLFGSNDRHSPLRQLSLRFLQRARRSYRSPQSKWTSVRLSKQRNKILVAFEASSTKAIG